MTSSSALGGVLGLAALLLLIGGRRIVASASPAPPVELWEEEDSAIALQLLQRRLRPNTSSPSTVGDADAGARKRAPRCDVRFESCWDALSEGWHRSESCVEASLDCRAALCQGRRSGWTSSRSSELDGRMDVMCRKFWRLGRGTFVASSSSDSKARRLEFLHIPKNAGSSIEEAGLKGGAQWGIRNPLLLPSVDHLSHDDTCNAYHMPPEMLLASGRPSPYAGAEVFCVVRHPYERLLSEYTYMQAMDWGVNLTSKYDNSIEAYPACSVDGLNNWIQKTVINHHSGWDCMEDCHIMPQSKFVWDSKGTQVCDQIFHMADPGFHGKFNRYMSDHGYNVTLSAPENSHHDSCGDLSVNDLNHHTQQMIQVEYREDFLRLGFSGNDQKIFEDAERAASEESFWKPDLQ